MKSLLDGPYLEYFEDGRRRILGGFQDDLLHGAYREFYRNTIPKCQGTLRRGKLNGLYVQWDDEGNRLFKAYFIGGALNNSYVLDYQVFASTPCLSRNGIYMELERLFEIQETYTFTELYDALIAKDLLDVDNQPEYQLLEILKEVAVRISGGEDHGKYKLKENIILV
jgi:antitoxin component YwqK of YwqJK toxin-antitoxin module